MYLFCASGCSRNRGIYPQARCSDRSISSKKLGVSFWRAALFAVMSRNALRATAFFSIPNDSVIELGVQVEV
jgi:K+ transporter